MSHANVELVRQALELLRESYVAGTATEGLLDLCTPEIRVDASRRVFNPDVYVGEAGIRRSIREICEAWEEFNERTEGLIDAGDRVVVLQTISGRGRVSKAHVEQKGALIWTVRDGRVKLIEVFGDPCEALKTAGLES